MDIPEDIAKAALTYVGEPVGGDDLTQRDVIATYVARAIIAERERCAKIAEDFDWVLPMFVDMKINDLTDDAACMVQEQIATAIRQPEPR